MGNTKLEMKTEYVPVFHKLKFEVVNLIKFKTKLPRYEAHHRMRKRKRKILNGKSLSK